MPFASALSRHPVAAVAVGEVVGNILEQAGPGAPPDLAVVFVSPGHVGAMDAIASTIQTLLNPAVFVGSSAVGVLAGAEGIEDRPGIALWTGSWPERRRAASRILPCALSATRALEDLLDLGEPSLNGVDDQLLLLADPGSFPVEPFLLGLAQRAPRLGVIGGFASTAHTPSGNRLVIGGRVVRTGAVGVLLPGELLAAPIVSQGCRPIGQPMTVTKANGNVIYELAGRPALDRVLELLESLDEAERALAALGLHCGLVVNEQKLDFERGDFLIRGVLGASREHRAVVIGDNAPTGTTVQFQVRDAATAGEDLEHHLLQRGDAADAALVFTCNGRGTAMFGNPSHDAALIAQHLGGPIAGMFCAGEIGPVGGHSAIHGFTASVALFRE